MTDRSSAFAGYGSASRSLADLLAYHKTSSDREIWAYELLKRHAAAAHVRISELKKLASRSAVVDASPSSEGRCVLLLR